MRLASFAIGLGIATVVAVSGGPTAHAQSNNQKKQTKKQTTAHVTSASVSSVVINPGDTLSAIATSHQTTYQRLFDANTQISDPDLIFPGQSVRIPDANEQLAHRDLPVKAAPVAVVTPTPAAQTAPAAPAYSAPAVAPQPAPVASSGSSGCGDNEYAHYIYSHESGCRTTAMSPNGCYGIGQACPASKLAYCGADYDCQNAFFTAYAAKYGGWAGAYNFWVSHGWW